MMPERDAILELIRGRVDGRPVRWADTKTSAGDFAGREWTVEVFDVAEADRLPLRTSLWDFLNGVSKHIGKQLSLVTHTPADTDSLYAWIHTEPAVLAIGRDLQVVVGQHTRPRVET